MSEGQGGIDEKYSTGSNATTADGGKKQLKNAGPRAAMSDLLPQTNG